MVRLEVTMLLWQLLEWRGCEFARTPLFVRLECFNCCSRYKASQPDCPLLGACLAWLSTGLEIVAGKRVYSLGKKQCPQLPQPEFMREEVNRSCGKMWKKCGAIYTTQTQKNQGCSNCFYCRKQSAKSIKFFTQKT